MAYSLSNIISGKSDLPSRVVVYGPNGIGKTTFAAGAVKPIGILTEEGIGNLDFARFPTVKSFTDVVEALKFLTDSKHEFRSVFLDSLDWTERLIFADLETRFSQKDLGYGKKYELAVGHWATILDLLDRLRTERKMLTILVGHTIVKRFEPPDGEAYDIYRLDLHEKSASFVRDWADVILFANYRVFTRETADGKRTIAVGEGDRVMYSQERPAFWAKNRYGLPFELPLNFSAFAEAMKAARGINGKTKEKAHAASETAASDQQPTA